MVRFDSYRAASLGNQASRNLVKKSTIGGRATLQAVTRVKLEQASKATMWTPTRRKIGEGRADWEEARRGSALSSNRTTSRATGVVSTACQGGNRFGLRCGERTLPLRRRSGNPDRHRARAQRSRRIPPGDSPIHCAHSSTCHQDPPRASHRRHRLERVLLAVDRCRGGGPGTLSGRKTHGANTGD